MNKNRLILAGLLLVFVFGMVLAPVAASHTIKVGKYKIKITNKQYKQLKKAYKKDKRYFVVSAKTNKKYHKATIQYMNVWDEQWERPIKRGFYLNVWDTRYGMDGVKIDGKRVRIK